MEHLKLQGGYSEQQVSAIMRKNIEL